MKRTVLFAGLVALLFLAMTCTAVAADVSGNWKIEARQGGQGGGGGRAPAERTLVLKQDGNALTGKLVTKRGDNPPNEAEIQNGKVNGDQIEFQVKTQGRGGQGETVTTYKAKVTDSKMEGTQQSGDRPERPFTAVKQ